MNTVLINEMTWVEFKEMMAVTDLVIVPVGSTEEHGLHNPLGTDFLIAGATAKAIGEKVKAPVAPVLPIGNARRLMDFPGTVSLDPELLRAVVREVCENLIRYGAKRFLFINGHGGNTAALKVVAADLYEKYHVIATQTEWWKILPQISEFPCNDHGGKYESAMMMAIAEHLVDLSKARNVQEQPLSKAFTFEYGLRFQGVQLADPRRVKHITSVGNYGAPAEEATRELGQQLFDRYVDYCAGLAEALRQIPL